MPARTTEMTVTFRHAFSMPTIDRPQPAGTYRVETDEQEVPGLSFMALRRTAPMFHLPAISPIGRRSKVVSIDPAERAAVLAADRQAPSIHARFMPALSPSAMCHRHWRFP